MDEPAQTVAIYGGSFDPPHIGHVLLASYVMGSVPIDRLLVIPTWKHALGKAACAPFDDRLRMCELAMSDLRHVEVSQIERELGGDSRTLNTVHALKSRLPEASFRLVLGADLIGELHLWHKFDEVAKLAPPIFAGRAGFASEKALPVALPDVSSTEIRSRIAGGQSVEGLVSHRVEAYIREHGLYAAKARTR